MRRHFAVRSVLTGSLAAALAACGGDKAADTNTAVSTDSATAADSSPGMVAGAGANAAGEAIYASNCIACHQANGQGMPGAFPPLAGSEWVTASVDRPIAILLHGLQGPITVAGTEYNGMMMAGGAMGPMTDQQIADVLTYVRSSWGNTAAAITTADVARVRAEQSSRSTAWTATELQALP